MPTLYVTEPGARVEKEYGRLIVTSADDEVLAQAPVGQVTEVVLVGLAGVTTPALLALLNAGSGLTLVTRGGKLLGRLRSAEARNLELRRKQYRCAADAGYCLAVSREIVTGKIKNSRTLLRRILRQDRLRLHADAQQAGVRSLASIRQAQDLSSSAADINTLRGIEGRAAKAYFSALRPALRSELAFGRRTRRPPEDPLNALLSLSYSMLTQAVFTACEVAGLDPYEGFYHADKYGRPALALDLVEEFRAVVADSVVIQLVNKRMLAETDFESGSGDSPGVYLTRRGMKKFLEQFSRRLNTPVFHPSAGRAISYQKVFEVQARRLRQAIETGEPDYAPFQAR